MAVQGCRTNSEIPRIPYNELSLEEFQVSGVVSGKRVSLHKISMYILTFNYVLNFRNLTLSLHDQ